MEKPEQIIHWKKLSKCFGGVILKKNKINICQFRLIILILFMLFNFSQLECKMIQSSTVINPTIYADYQSTSYLSGHPDITGKIKWKYKTMDDDIPVHLSLVGNLLIVGAQRSVSAIDFSIGNLIWNEPVRKEFDHVCTDEGVLVNTYFKLLNYKKKEYVSSFISTSEPSYMTFFQKSSSKILYAFKNIYESPERGGAPWEPWFTVMRYENEARKSYFSFSEEIHSTLLTKDDKCMVLLSKDKSYVIHPQGDMQNEKALSVTHTDVLCGSLSEAGTLLLIEKRKEKNILTCSPIDGKPMWETVLPDIALSNQPPAITPSGNILYMAGETLLSINNGKIQWSTEITNVPQYSYIVSVK